MLCAVSDSLKILLVEDDFSLREVVRQYLSIYHDVSAAADLAQARPLLLEKSFDLVLLDKRLPDGSGLDLLTNINEHAPHTAVVILTSDGEFDSITKALSQGADDYVVKSEHLIQHLLVRIPVAVKHAQDRARLKELEARSSVCIPERSQSFSPEGYRASTQFFEKEYLSAALAAHDGNVLLTASKLGISRSTLFRKIAELGMGKRFETKLELTPESGLERL